MYIKEYNFLNYLQFREVEQSHHVFFFFHFSKCHVFDSIGHVVSAHMPWHLICLISSNLVEL